MFRMRTNGKALPTESEQDTPALSPVPQRVSRARVAVVGFALVGVVCAGWLWYELVTDLLADLAYVLLPAGAMATVVLGVVLGWRAGFLKRWPRTRIAGIALVLMVAIPPTLYAGWVVKLTAEASRGAACPQCAVIRYVAQLMEQPVSLRNILCDERRDELDREASAWRASYQAALAKWNHTAQLESARAEERRDGDQASVDVPVRHTHQRHWREGGQPVSSHFVAWHFRLVDDGGWRVCEARLPDICAQVIKCEGPTPTPSALSPSGSPTYRPWSDWDNRVRWECFPDAGPFARFDCPSPPAGWLQPGPAYCAPAFPEMLRNPEQAAHCRAQGWNVTSR